MKKCINCNNEFIEDHFNQKYYSFRANHIKNNGTIDELEKILAYMKREINE